MTNREKFKEVFGFEPNMDDNVKYIFQYLSNDSEKYCDKCTGCKYDENDNCYACDWWEDKYECKVNG